MRAGTAQMKHINSTIKITLGKYARPVQESNIDVLYVGKLLLSKWLGNIKR